MRTLTLRYDGECRKCGAELKEGEEGVYERRVGVFCVGCPPTDPDEIREYRQEAGDRRADQYEEWAAKRRADATATLEHNREHYWSDWALVTQPGHIPLRSRLIAQDDRAHESLVTAERFDRKAESLRNVQVAGDTERRRQAKREANDDRFGKGDRIRTAMYGFGTIVSVHKKSFRVAWDSGHTCSVDKSWVEEL